MTHISKVEVSGIEIPQNYKDQELRRKRQSKEEILREQQEARKRYGEKMRKQDERKAKYTSMLKDYLTNNLEGKMLAKNGIYRANVMRKDVEIVNFERFCNGFVWALGQITEQKEPNISLETSKLVRFMFGLDVEGFSHKKGLLLCGGTGTGKTSFFKALMLMQKYMILAKPLDGFQNVKDVVKDFKALGNYNHYLHQNFVFDDLGYEELANSYKDTTDVIGDVFFKRNELKLITHATTNLTIEQLEERYQGRVASRLYEMFNIIEFNSLDIRFLNKNIIKF